jgi:hypothetical protein
MTAASCSCGFTELDDETMTDHLHSVFEPDDRKGTDGQLHEEGEHLACWCGFAAATPEDLDDHFLAVFTPGDGIGRDGKKHEVTGGA